MSAANFTVADILESQLRLLPKFFCAFQECSPEIQDIVLRMARIIGDPEAAEDEREHAFDTFLEALLPGYTADFREMHEQIIRSPEGVRLRETLHQEEAAFAERLKRIMEEQGVSQQELAGKVGVGQPAISNMLNRQCRPQRRTVRRLAQALGVSPDELWSGFSAEE